MESAITVFIFLAVISLPVVITVAIIAGVVSLLV